MGVSKNGVTPKSSILIGFSIINHPFWDTPIFGNTQMGPNSGVIKQCKGLVILRDDVPLKEWCIKFGLVM